MNQKMRPRGDALFVKPIIEEYHGLIKQPDRLKQTLTYGTVLATGPKVSEDIKVGAEVFYSSFVGFRFKKTDDRSIIQLRDNEVLAIKDNDKGVDVEIGELGYVKG